MEPVTTLVTAIRIGVLVVFGVVLVWAAHQRAVVHHIWRQRVRDEHTRVATFPGWVAVGSAAGLV